jgi:hypothetical protein
VESFVNIISKRMRQRVVPNAAVLRLILLIVFAFCYFPRTSATSGDRDLVAATYQLDSIEVTRKYKDWDFNITPGTTDNPGTQSVGTGQHNFRMGWDVSFTPSSGCAGRSHASASVDITQLPATLEGGSNATFSVSMSGEWQTACYENVRDHTIQLSGVVEKSWSIDEKPNGSYSGSIEASNTIMIPEGGGDELSYDINSRINFGGDNWCNMTIHMVYKCHQNCANSDRLSARLICKDPLVLHPTTKDSVHEEVCTVCIHGWRKTSDPVEVVFPEQIDSYGLHSNGIKVFPGGSDGTAIGPMAMDPSRLSGYRCPDNDSFLALEYPWGFFIKADSEAVPGKSFAVPIIVRQKGAGEAKVVLRGSVASRNVYPYVKPPEAHVKPPESHTPPTPNPSKGSTCLAYDPGAGIKDKKPHVDWASSQPKDTLINNLGSKIDHLYGCQQFDSDGFTKLFADLSKLLVQYDSDPECYGGDTGAASSDWQAHKNWADALVSQGNKKRILDNIKWKIGQVMGCINQNQQVELFGDASVLIATSAP